MKKMKTHQTESGNVLFLILIAVALFAALSYAVTQSSRSGGGDAGKETNLVASAQLTQYPAGVRTSIIRMVVSDNVDVTTLRFNPPSDFAAGCATATTQALCVFHPNGGGAIFDQAPPDMMEDGNPGPWTFNGDFEIVNIGTSDAADGDGNEIIAFLPGIKKAVCEKINSELGMANVPVITTTVAGVDDTTAGYLRMMDDGVGVSSTQIVLGTGGAAGSNIADFDGQPYGCFRNTAAGDYVYYHVLVER